MSGMINGPVVGGDHNNPERVASVEATDVPQESVRRGRPKKNNSSDQDVRTTIILNRIQQNKLKYAAMVDNKPMKEILSSLIDKYLTDWERKHGSFPEHIQVEE